MPKLTPATTQSRRDHIIAAAMQSLLKHGLSGTTVDSVCAEGGISKGAFYSHFESKDALIRGVLAARSSEIRTPIGGDTIDALARSIFEGCMAPAMGPAEARFGLELMATTTTEADLRAAYLYNLDMTRTAIARAIGALIDSGVARPDCDPAAAAGIVEVFLLGALTRNALAPMMPDEVLGSLRRLLRDLVGRQYMDG